MTTKEARRWLLRLRKAYVGEFMHCRILTLPTDLQFIQLVDRGRGDAEEETPV